MHDVDIPLDVRLSSQENAAKYFKKYTKAKTAEKYLTEQMEKGRAELMYLESVQQELALAESEQDFNDIRAELADGGYLRRGGNGKKAAFQRPSKPREFRSRRTAYSGGPQQPAERPPYRQGRGKVGSVAAHPEDPRQPRHPLHRRY